MRDVGARPGVRVDRGRRGDGSASGSARQDQSYKLETTRLRENADSIRHGGIEIKSLDAPCIACNADFNIQPNFRQEIEQKLMAPRRRLITA
jgi:hypothetical protein